MDKTIPLKAAIDKMARILEQAYLNKVDAKELAEAALTPLADGEAPDAPESVGPSFIVPICGIDYWVDFKPDNFTADAVHFGEIDYKAAKIYLNEAASTQIQHETLCHEILHAIFYHTGHEDLSKDESLVQALGNAINQSFVPQCKGGKVKG